MRADRVVARILKREGCEWMAAFPAQPLIEEAAAEGIRPIIPRQERAGVNIADGLSRVSNGRRVGVFAMQAGPGAENAFSGVAQAYADSVPMLLLPGGVGRDRHGIHPNFDAASNYRAITKWSIRVEDPATVPDVMRMAFNQLRSGRRGPVLVEIPRDVAAAEIEDATNYRPVQVRRSMAADDDVESVVRRLLEADRPMIIAGEEILYSEATSQLIDFAELTDVPVMTRLGGKSAFPEDHQLSLGTGGASATLMVAHFLDSTDFILGIGTSFTSSYFDAALPQAAAIGQVSAVGEDLGKERAIECGAVGDVALVLAQMTEVARRSLGESPRDTGVSSDIAEVKREFWRRWGPRFDSDEVPISPYRVFKDLWTALDPKETIITHDSGYPRDQLVPFWPAVSPRGYLGWGKSTQLGYGLGLAIGAKLGRPEKYVVNVMGDAAFGMAGMDIETAVRVRAGILTVVLNNGVMMAYDEKMPQAVRDFGIHRLGGDYAAVAAGLGAHSERVADPSRLSGALREALESTVNGVPALVEVLTKEEPDVPRYEV